MKLTYEEIITQVERSFRTIRGDVVAHAGVVVATIKHDGTPQTAMDLMAEKAILDSLKAISSDLACFGEESGLPKAFPHVYCLVDAIDGTKSYIEGVGAYTGMVVIIEGTVPVASIIYDYTNDIAYTAYKGKGAFRNDVRINLSTMPLVQRAYCRERLVEAINEIMKDSDDKIICEAGPTGAGYGFLLVSDGKIAARFNFPHSIGKGNVHDYAPGALLVEEAGGVVVPIDSTEDHYTIDSKSFVACHPELAGFIKSHAEEIRAVELSIS